MLNLSLHKEPLSYASIKEKDETVSSLIETFTVEKNIAKEILPKNLNISSNIYYIIEC